MREHFNRNQPKKIELGDNNNVRAWEHDAYFSSGISLR
jgi:hypothetical protein